MQEDGTTKYSKRGGFASEKDAELSYYKYEEEYKKAYRSYQARNKVDTNIGFRDYLIYWFEDVYSQRIQNTTRMIGAYVLYDLILPDLEQDIKLKYINDEFLNLLLDKVSQKTNSAGNKCREFLNIALKEAVTSGYIKTNVVESTKAYPRNKPSIIILNKERTKQFLSVATNSNWYLEILFALFCGLRKGELLGLKFSDFDFSEDTVFIQRQITSNPIVERGDSKIVSYNIEEREPKTENSYRKLKVPKVIMDEVKKRREWVEECKARLQEDYCDKEYVSCRENGLPHSITAINNALTKLCNRNGFPHLTVHGLRHMYATILLEQGVPLVKISALLGHSSVNTTFEYYCDQMDETEKIIGFMNNTFSLDGGEKVG